MTGNSSLEYKFVIDDGRQLKPVRQYGDVGFPAGLIDNLAKAGFNKPSKLQQDVLQCMDNNLCLIGNVPDNLDAHAAYIAYAIHDCVKSKHEGTFRSDEYKPFALFIVKDDETMKNLRLFATDLAANMEVTTAMLSAEQFDNEAKCELELQECDLVFLTAEGFNKYIKTELILFENLKILIVHQLEWENDKKRIVQYSDMFRYHDFPKPSERILVFFDENYTTPATDLFDDDKKAYLVFGPGDGKKKLRNFVINDGDVNTEIEEVFEICKTSQEKDAALLKHLGELSEAVEEGKMGQDFPRTVIYVEESPVGNRVCRLIKRAKFHCFFADGYRKRSDVRTTIDYFNNKSAPILIACNLERIVEKPEFKEIVNVIHYDAPDDDCCMYRYFIHSQIQEDSYHTPKKIISLLGAVNYPAYKAIMNDYIKRKKSVEKLEPVVDALKLLYDQIPVEEGDDDDDY